MSICYLLAKIGLDTAENEPSNVCRYQHQHSTPPWSIGSALVTVDRARPTVARRLAARVVLAEVRVTWRDEGPMHPDVPLEGANFTGPLLGCIQAECCKKKCV